MKYFLMLAISLLLFSCGETIENYNKFQQLNNSLEEFEKDSQVKSKDLLTAIDEKVKERGNKTAEIKALDEANKLHALSTNLITYIETLKKRCLFQLLRHPLNLP